MVEEGDTVAVIGRGSVALGDGDPVDFVYSEVFTFADGLICRLDTFHVWLGEVPSGVTIDYARHCAEIVTQTTLLTGHSHDADVTVPVPTCPGWNVSQLARHVDGGQRWAREIVATRASAPPPDVALRDLSGAADEDPETLRRSLSEAAACLASTPHRTAVRVARSALARERTPTPTG